MKNVVFASAFAFVAVACGRLQNDEDKGASASDAAVVEAAVLEASASDAVEAAAVGESGGSALGLTLAADGESARNFERVCEAKEGGSVLVTVSGEFERNFAFDRPQISLVRTVKGSGVSKRLWSQEGQTLQCANDHVAIDFANVTGLKLVVDAERSREASQTLVHKKSGKEIRREHSYSLQAHREVEFISASAGATELQIEKKIVSSATRNLHMLKPNGETRDVELTVATKGGAPLLVRIARTKTAPRTLLSKTLVSGVLVSSTASGEKVETAFDNLKLSWENGQCAPASGSYVVTFLQSESQSAKVVSCAAAEGSVSCRNEAGEAVEVLPPACDPEDAE